MVLDDDTNVLVQGITGSQGSFHTKLMLEYGTNVVAGVTPGKGGQEEHGVPVYGSVADAVDEHDVDWSVGFVPSPYAKDAALDALEHGVHACVITEHVPVHDATDIVQTARSNDLRVIGPNCPGVTVPGSGKMGIMPADIFSEGSVGVVSRSGTLTYEIVDQLTHNGYGQSCAIGIGGDPVIGMDFRDVLRRYDEDPGTDRIVLIGEIGGDLEERAAALIEDEIGTPVVAYIAGRTAPEGKQMGHAGAIVYGDTGTAESKIAALEGAGVTVAELPSDVPDLL